MVKHRRMVGEYMAKFEEEVEFPKKEKDTEINDEQKKEGDENRPLDF